MLIKGSALSIFLALALSALSPAFSAAAEQPGQSRSSNVKPAATQVPDRAAFDLLKEGVKHFNRMEFEASVDFFRKSLGKSPSDRRARFFLGMAYYKAGFDENAALELNNLLNNGQGDELLSNFVRYLSLKQLKLDPERKSEDYTISREIIGTPLGKYTVSKITGFDVDDELNMYIAGFGSKIALKVQQTGKPVLAFVSPAVTPGRLYDIVTDGKGLVYISDFSNDAVYQFTSDGKYILSFGASGFQEGQFYGPTSLALDQSGDIYVIDSGNLRIEKFSKEGEFLLAFGKEGDGEGEFLHPSGIAVDYAGRIYVADHGKKKVQVYDRSGNHIGALPGLALKDPYGLSFAGQNRLIVADQDRILSYDLTYSTWTEIDTGGRLRRALDARIDQLEQLYTVDFERDSILQFVPKVDKYRNLTVILDRVDMASFPAVGYYVTVMDADGLPVYGLEAQNFIPTLGEGGVGKVDLLANEKRNSRLSILFLVDKSPAMATYQNDLKVYLGELLAKVSEEDQMAVVSFNSDSWIASSFTRSRLRTMDAITESRFREGKAFDKAFRRAVDYLNKEFYKKALVFITDGMLDEQSFRNYSFQSSLNYAMNNHIPVYILSFSGEVNEKLSYFARSTGGKFYDVLHANDFPYMYGAMRDFRYPQYLVVFNEPPNPSLKGLYLDAEVEVNFNGRTGKNGLGCIYPK